MEQTGRFTEISSVLSPPLADEERLRWERGHEVRRSRSGGRGLSRGRGRGAACHGRRQFGPAPGSRPRLSRIHHPADELKYGYAGGADVMVGEEHSWHFTGTANESAEPMLVPRGRVTGGTSAINGQGVPAGTARGLRRLGGRGSTEWSFEKVLPFFRRLETDMDSPTTSHGVDGPVPLSAAARIGVARVAEGVPPSLRGGRV